MLACARLVRVSIHLQQPGSSSGRFPGVQGYVSTGQPLGKQRRPRPVAPAGIPWGHSHVCTVTQTDRTPHRTARGPVPRGRWAPCTVVRSLHGRRVIVRWSLRWANDRTTVQLPEKPRPTGPETVRSLCRQYPCTVQVHQNGRLTLSHPLEVGLSRICDKGILYCQ